MLNKLSTAQIIQNNLARTKPLLLSQTYLVLHNIRSKHNVGAAFRSADAFGVHKILLSGFTPKPPEAEIHKTALGAEQHVAWEAISSIENLLETYPKSDFKYVGIEQTTNSTMLNEYKINDRPTLYIFGNEVKGIDNELIPHLDQVVEIPQFGHKHSLNVSVSLGIVLYAIFAKSV